jgi:hypothetical protein
MIKSCILVERWKHQNGTNQAKSQIHKPDIEKRRATVGIKRKEPRDSHQTLGFNLQGNEKSDSHKIVI